MIGILASQAFTPNKIANLNLDLDASDLSTIVDSGGSVSEWNYKNGGGSVIQVSGVSQPLTGVNTINGKNALAFDGTNSFMRKNPFQASADMTLFIVSNVISTSNLFDSILTMNGDNDFQIQADVVGQYRAGLNTVGLGATTPPANPSSLIGAPFLLNYRFSVNDLNVVLRINGAQVDSDTYNGLLSSEQSFFLGRNRGGTRKPVVDIGQVIIYDRDLTLPEMVQVETYLSNKWGLA